MSFIICGERLFMSLTKQEKQEITDSIGEKIIEFRDRGLNAIMEWATGESINPIMAEKYGELTKLSNNQYELVCDLLSEAFTTAIYDFLEMFE